MLTAADRPNHPNSHQVCESRPERLPHLRVLEAESIHILLERRGVLRVSFRFSEGEGI